MTTITLETVAGELRAIREIVAESVRESARFYRHRHHACGSTYRREMMDKRPIHQYEVEIARHVWRPEYGPEAYYTSTKRTSFPFGKGHKTKTGQEALNQSEEFARANMESASRVIIWKFHGYSGIGSTLKNVA